MVFGRTCSAFRKVSRGLCFAGFDGFARFVDGSSNAPVMYLGVMKSRYAREATDTTGSTVRSAILRSLVATA
jgi:hypothetical protein